MNEEWNKRYEAAEAGRHAPGQLCECWEMNGDKGTFVCKSILTSAGKGLVYQRAEVAWKPFLSMLTYEKRMSCYGAVQDNTSSWEWRHNKTGLPIHEHIKAARRAKLRRILWRHIPTAIWVVFHLMELAAMRAEERRIARIAVVFAAQKITEAEMQTINQVLEL